MKQTLKYIFGVVYENMKFAETKHSIVITLSGAVIAFSSTFFSNNVLQNMLAIAGIVFALIAILYSFVALVARRVRISNKHKKKVNNLINYKDIIKFDEISYINQLKKEYDFTNLYKPDKMDYDLAKNIIIYSKLTYIKLLYFNLAVIFLFASILSLILAVLINGGIW